MARASLVSKKAWIFSRIMKGPFTLDVEIPPSNGSVYTIRHKHGKTEAYTVFIPDIDANGQNQHCQSTFHVHTAFWIRDRWFQRALMESDKNTTRHTTRS
jgi:hypothetical protein